MQSPFQTHRDKVLGHYSTATWLRGVVLAMWNGKAYPVGLSQLTNLDAAHFAAFTEMVSHYKQHGENDTAFMELAEEAVAREKAEEKAREREAQLSEWLLDVKESLRAGRRPSGLADDYYAWFSSRFDAGDSAEAAAEAFQEPVGTAD